MNHRSKGIRLLGFVFLVGAALALVACDRLAMDKLKVGVSTEADVVRHMGQPARVWMEPGGARTLEYDRQPAGVRNYMITVDSDGRMSALEQVLTRATFARVQPGMDGEAVHRLLGLPARKIPYRLKNQTVWTWRFLESPNETKGFDVTFDAQGRVVDSGIGPDPDGPESVGGG